MKSFDLFIEPFVFFLELETKAKHKNGQGLLAPFMPGSAGGNQNFIFLYPMTFCITSGGKFWYPKYLEFVSDEIWIAAGEIVLYPVLRTSLLLRFLATGIT